jgi:hypothetical protein
MIHSMGTGAIWFIGAVGFAAFGVFLRFAVQALVDQKYRNSTVWFFWSFLPLLVVCFVLLAKGEPSMSDATRNIILGLVGAAVGASVSIWIGYAIVGIAANAQGSQGSAMPSVNNAQPQAIITGGDNVVSIGQIGGITARTVTINPPMRPELRIIGKTETDNVDGTHTVVIRTEVVSPITPGLLAIQIAAEEIQNVSIVAPPRDGVSVMQMRNVRSGPNSFSAEIPSPRGEYDISVKTRVPSPIRIDATF